MNPCEFIYINEPVQKIDEAEHKEFLVNIQNAMLLFLVERKLLTKEQAEQVLKAI